MKTGKWICYKGDYPIYLAEKVQTMRYQRDFPIAPFWRVDSPWHNIRFYKEFTLEKPSNLKFYSEGRISVFLKRPAYEFNDYYSYDFTGELYLKAGSYSLEVYVYNPNGLPCLKIDGDEFCSDETFLAGENYIDLIPVQICNCKDMTPNTYTLPLRKVDNYIKFEKNGDVVYDLGKILFAFVKVYGKGKCQLYFGETLNEAFNDISQVGLVESKTFFGEDVSVEKDTYCEQIEKFDLKNGNSHFSEISKAFRYLRICGNISQVEIFEEYDDNVSLTSFESNDKLLKDIFDVSKYTFSVCARQFFLDGAKRDRWIWAGDAYEGQKAEYFYQYNSDRIKDSIIALFGKSPVKRYINHIMDYTFYNIISVWEYYINSGDKQFLSDICPILTEHIDFCISKLNQNGFIQSSKLNGNFVDWIFVDWGDLPNKNGEVSSEQILFWKALRCVVDIYSVLNLNSVKYLKLSNILFKKINKVFWNKKKGSFIFARNNGVLDNNITCHSNIFAICFGFCSEKQKNQIIDNFIDNKISLSITPFMIEFILEALLSNNLFDSADKLLRSFWGGMISQGANTFWETYSDGETLENSSAMYARPFGRSHCHIWGAGPLYLIPRFYFGIKLTDFGNSFTVNPNFDFIKNSKIVVPLKVGSLSITVNDSAVSVLSTDLDGKIIINNNIFSITHGETFYENI